jgi:hypothetical protein
MLRGYPRECRIVRRHWEYTQETKSKARADMYANFVSVSRRGVFNIHLSYQRNLKNAFGILTVKNKLSLNDALIENSA